MVKVLSFSTVILDVDIEPKKALLAVAMVSRIRTYTIGHEIKQFRSYKCSIDLSKSVRLKFFEVCA